MNDALARDTRNCIESIQELLLIIFSNTQMKTVYACLSLLQNKLGSLQQIVTPALLLLIRALLYHRPSYFGVGMPSLLHQHQLSPLLFSPGYTSSFVTYQP